MSFRQMLQFLESGARFYSDDPGPGPAGNPGDQGGGAIDLRAQAQRKLDNNEDAIGVIAGLMGETRRYRDQIRDLQTKVAPDGGMVLTKAQAEQWAAYQALGDPAEVKTRLGEVETLGGEVKNFRLAKAAALAGADAGVLESIGAAGWEIIIKDEKDDKGAAVQRVYVKDGDKETPLREYVQARSPRLLSAVFSDGGDDQGLASNKRAGRAVPLPKGGNGQAQGAGGQGGQGGKKTLAEEMAEKFAAERAAKRSPLAVAEKRADPSAS